MPEDLFEREGVPHSNTRYTMGKCRCDICKADHAQYQLEATIKRRNRLDELPFEAHGILGTYTNWGAAAAAARSPGRTTAVTVVPVRRPLLLCLMRPALHPLETLTRPKVKSCVTWALLTLW